MDDTTNTSVPEFSEDQNATGGQARPERIYLSSLPPHGVAALVKAIRKYRLKRQPEAVESEWMEPLLRELERVPKDYAITVYARKWQP